MAVSDPTIGIVLFLNGMIGAVGVVIAAPLAVMSLSALGLAGLIVGSRSQRPDWRPATNETLSNLETR